MKSSFVADAVLSPPAACADAAGAGSPSPPTIPPLSAIGTVLVLGARGRLGYACVQAFAQAGWRVLAQVRSGSSLVHPSTASNAAGLVTWVSVTLNDLIAWQIMLAEQGPVHVVVNALAPDFSARAWAAQLHALGHASIQVARQSNALLLQPASVLSYGSALPAVLYEHDVLPPLEQITTATGMLSAQSELQLRMAAESGVQVCVLRSGTYYGAVGASWSSHVVMAQLPRGRMQWLGPYNIPTPWMYVGDLAKTLQRVASERHRLGVWSRLHVAGHQRCGHDWQHALLQVAQQRGWLREGAALHESKVPWLWRKPVGWFSSRIRAHNELEYIWRQPHQLDNAALRGLIGQEPCSDWLSSVEQSVETLFPRLSLPREV